MAARLTRKRGRSPEESAGRMIGRWHIKETFRQPREGRVLSRYESASGAARPRGAAMRVWNVEALRRQFPQTGSMIYLNTGTVGLCPLPVVEALLEQTRAFEIVGQPGWGPAETAMNEARLRLAGRLGARADDLVFTRNASD